MENISEAGNFTHKPQHMFVSLHLPNYGYIFINLFPALLPLLFLSNSSILSH